MSWETSPYGQPKVSQWCMEMFMGVEKASLKRLENDRSSV